MAKNCDDNMLSRFHMVPERNGRTDRFAISVSRVSMLTRDKNRSNVRASVQHYQNHEAPCKVV